jgi:hypothetical protein
LDLSNATIRTPRKENLISILRRNTPPPKVPPLEAAIFNFIDMENQPPSAWDATNQLKTTKVLLQHGARFEKYMVAMLKEQDNEYTRLLLSLAKDRDMLKNFDAKVEALYPKSAVIMALSRLVMDNPYTCHVYGD